MVLIGVCIVVASTATSLFPVLLLWLVAGGGNAVATVSYESLLQETTPDHLRGRVVAGSEAVLDSAIIFGALTAGWLGSAYGARGAYVISGLILISVGTFGRILVAPAGQKSPGEAPSVGGMPQPAASAPPL
jgi:NRE family putative nickel resistance protein-like MFS transporter